MNLVADLKQYIQENKYTLIYPVRSGVIALFKQVQPGTNPNVEFKHSYWQVNYAWQNTLSLSQWTVLTPVQVHPQDAFTLGMVKFAYPPNFLEEILTVNQPVV